MRTISIESERTVHGPLSADAMKIVNLLIKGASDPITLRKTTNFALSKVWKVLIDLKSLKLIRFNQSR